MFLKLCDLTFREFSNCLIASKIGEVATFFFGPSLWSGVVVSVKLALAASSVNVLSSVYLEDSGSFWADFFVLTICGALQIIFNLKK